MVQNITRHQLVLLCAFFVSLSHSFVAPNKVSLSTPLLLSHPQKEWRRAYNECLVRFASSSLPFDDCDSLFTESPVLIFQQLVGHDRDSPALVRVEELQRWDELQDLLADEDISQTELEDMVAEITKDKGTNNDKLDEASFVLLYKMIEDLFVYENNEDTTDIEIAPVELAGSGSEDQRSLPNKQGELLSFLTDIIPSGPNKLPCGIDCTDKEREIIAKMVSDLEGVSNNLVLKNNGKIAATDLIGDWDLLYTNSKAMIINKSLSGLVGSPSQQAEFSGVRQRLTGSKFLGFVEYIETFNAGTEESFDVKITGEWELKEDRNPRTGQPATAIKMDPDKIEYGSVYGMTEQAPVTQLGGGLSQGASWQSLGPIKLLDIIYLTADLQIARGNSNIQAIFVWKKRK